MFYPKKPVIMPDLIFNDDKKLAPGLETKGLFIIYWEYRTDFSGYGTRTFFNASEYGTQRFFVFLWYGT